MKQSCQNTSRESVLHFFCTGNPQRLKTHGLDGAYQRSVTARRHTSMYLQRPQASYTLCALIPRAQLRRTCDDCLVKGWVTAANEMSTATFGVVGSPEEGTLYLHTYLILRSRAIICPDAPGWKTQIPYQGPSSGIDIKSTDAKKIN